MVSFIDEINNSPRSYQNVQLYQGSKVPIHDNDRPDYTTLDVSFENFSYIHLS